MILPARRLGALMVPPPAACRVGAPDDRPAEEDPDDGDPNVGEGGVPSEGDTAELPDSGDAGEAAEAAGLAEGDAGVTTGDAGAGAGAGSVNPLGGAVLGGGTTDIDDAVGSSNCWEKGSWVPGVGTTATEIVAADAHAAGITHFSVEPETVPLACFPVQS